MKSPKQIEKLSVAEDEVPLGPYPPLGFVPVWDAELGNGDYYGLYWPLGKEDEEPIICDMYHDEGSLKPAFTSVDKFIEWLEINDWERGEKEVVDPELPSILFNQAKSLYSSSDIESAITLLKQACSNFPEVSEYWFALSSQSKRIGDIETAAHAAIKSLNSNWVFDYPVEGVIRTLRNNQIREVLSNDPIVARIDEFYLGFGGVKENSIYPLMHECVQEYFNHEQYIDVLMLYQNYAYMMCSETGSFQERYDFNINNWQSGFSELCLKYLRNCRIFTR